MKEPDYDNYSLEQLYEALEMIDRERWPERVRKIESLLSEPESFRRLKKEQRMVDQQEALERKEASQGFLGILLLVSGGIGSFTGSFLTKYGVFQIAPGFWRILAGIGLACFGALIIVKLFRRG